MSQTAMVPKTNESTACAFFNTWYADCTRGWITIWTAQDKQTRWFHVKELTGAAKAAVQLAEQGMDVYFGVGLRQKKTHSNKRGSADTIMTIPGVWLDVDYGDTHKEKAIPPTLEAALELIDAFPYEPSILVHSGFGLHGYWKFQTPVEIENERMREEVQHYLSRFQGTFRHAASQKGWKIDNTADLPRVLRVPGTLNCKKGDPVDVRILRPTIRSERDRETIH
jgi:putative DNA primase/helicase